jgi:histidinol-phosphate aminotransferase
MTNIKNHSLVVPEHVSALQPYIPGKPIDDLVREFGLKPEQVVKLASNENPLGMPASAKRAIEQALGQLGRYPDPGGYALKQAIASQFNVPIEWVTLGNGSNDILELVSLALLVPGDAVVYAQYSFSVYRIATQARGARHIVVPACEYGHDLDAMFDAIDDQTRLVFVANPNNPTGTFLPAAAIERFMQRVQASFGDRVTVVLDEAYNEYIDPEMRVDSVALVKKFSNVVVSRSFSKAYGLAGLRVGYGVSQPPLTNLMARVRQPFNVNALAQAAAIAALHDEDFLRQSAAVNATGKLQLENGFKALGLPYVPSYANFVLVQVGAKALDINQALLKRGVIVRPVGADGLPEWLRVSVGLETENAIFLEALTHVLAEVLPEKLPEVLPK